MSLSVDVSLSLGRFDLQANFTVGDGEVLAVLGPNGAGKSTLLRAVAGLTALDSGRILLSGQVLVDIDPTGGRGGVDLPPDRRSTGVVFQDYLLFPHLSVLENVAFGPRARGVTKAAATELAAAWLARVGLAGLGTARPSTLSGGQAQRVALARALATDPAVLLLDEPLSALDATTRATTRRELRSHLGGFDGPTILVTHDPLDALALADRVLVLENGRISQIGTLSEVTARPRTPYVADLLGVNLLRGVAKGREVFVGPGGGSGEVATVCVAVGEAHDGEVFVLLRPRSIALHRRRPETSARNVWEFSVAGLDQMGERVQVRLSGPLTLVAEVTPESVGSMGLVEGTVVWGSVKATELSVYQR